MPAHRGSAPSRMRTTAEWASVALVVAALGLLADAASEGRSVVLSMLVVGLVFIGVIVLGELNNYFGRKRRAARRRTL
jgi:hypothetical protein